MKTFEKIKNFLDEDEKKCKKKEKELRTGISSGGQYPPGYGKQTYSEEPPTSWKTIIWYIVFIVWFVGGLMIAS